MNDLGQIITIMTAAAAELRADNDAAEQFSFDAKCRELAAHFMPDGDALDLDYFAQFIQDTADEFLREKREFDERNYDPSPWCTSCGARTAAKCTCGGEANRDPMD